MSARPSQRRGCEACCLDSLLVPAIPNVKLVSSKEMP
jgi:hypothetical protein